MTLHAEAISTTGAGGTADTFDDVGTVTTRDDATQVLGIWVVAAPVVSAAAEAIQGQVRITMDGVGSRLFPAPPYMGGDPATNVGFRPILPKFIPFVHDITGGTDVQVEYSTHVQDPTNANAVVACVVFVAGTRNPGLPSDPDIMKHFPYAAPLAGGADTEALGQVLTVAESSVTDLIIPNDQAEIVGFEQTITPDLMTGGEEVIGFVRYRSSIADVEPQEWPLNAYAAPLGTPVGTGGHIAENRAMAAWIPAPSKRSTITPNVVLVAAVTTGHSVVCSAYYR